MKNSPIVGLSETLLLAILTANGGGNFGEYVPMAIAAEMSIIGGKKYLIFFGNATGFPRNGKLFDFEVFENIFIPLNRLGFYEIKFRLRKTRI